MSIFRTALAGLVLLPCLAVPALQAQERHAADLLREASVHYANLGGLCSDFRQRLEVTLLSRVTEGRGVLCQRSPNLFSMRFTDPDGDRIVVDGEWMWMYTPSTDPGQVLQFAAGGNEGRFNFHRAFLEDPETRFDVVDEGTETVAGSPARVLKLTPTGSSNIEWARIWIDPESLLITQVQILDVNESVRTITLTNQRLNPDLPADYFEFSVPEGARVVKR